MVQYGGPRPIKARATYPTRAFTTTYHNTTGRPLLVLVVVECDRTADTDAAFARGVIGTPAPSDIVSRGGFAQGLAGSGILKEVYWQLAFIVPPGYYYRVESFTSGTGSVRPKEWCEVEL